MTSLWCPLRLAVPAFGHMASAGSLRPSKGSSDWQSKMSSHLPYAGRGREDELDWLNEARVEGGLSSQDGHLPLESCYRWQGLWARFQSNSSCYLAFLWEQLRAYLAWGYRLRSCVFQTTSADARLTVLDRCYSSYACEWGCLLRNSCHSIKLNSSYLLTVSL